MKAILNKEIFFKSLPKINILLFLSAVVLSGYLIFSIVRTYQTVILRSEDFKVQSSKSINKEPKYRGDKISVFDEDIFKRRSLFKPAQE